LTSTLVRQQLTAGPCAEWRQSPSDWDGVKVQRDILIAQWIPVGIVAGTVLTLQVAFPASAAAGDLNSVIDSIRAWVAGLLAGLATLFLTIGGVRYLAANGNPRAIEEGKSAIKSALIGYALAALSPMLVDILRRVLGT
jgi:hypothetical protein